MAARSLTGRYPVVGADDLLASMQPPPQFAHVSFDSYLAAPDEPSQSAALSAARHFGRPARPRSRRWSLLRGQPPAHGQPGIYFDGGFGVGKTHLLAALWHEHAGPKAFGTFVEYTALVGALGYAEAVTAFSDHALVCIDEFELDDPGDTVMMSTFLGHLVDSGVRLAATSNTLPDRLGEGRFAADDFLREIQGLSAHFEVVRIEGPDYRHRGAVRPAPALSTEDVQDLAASTPDSSVDDFWSLLDHLREVHPSRYGALVSDCSLVGLTGVAPLTDQADALRWVAFVDRLYDRQVAVAAAGWSVTDLFPADMLAGGYRKKYQRCRSRLGALAVRP